MTSPFSEELLAEKLSKVNNSQQCIETLSHWCIFHRSKAEQVVATWDKQFHRSEMPLKSSLLNLANDILQNSKRNGNEFVTGFWKVLPSALKDIVGKAGEKEQKQAFRLVNIWEERKVFGSHSKGLKEIMLGEDAPAPLEFGKKRSRSVRIVKKDARSIKTKLIVGGMAEKIVTAFHMVQNEQSNESEEMNKCTSVVNRVRKMERDVNAALSKAKDPKRQPLAKELEEEENNLKKSIDKLKLVEANRLALVSQLRAAVQDQEAELENVRTQIQVANAQLEQAGNMRKCLVNENYVADPNSSAADAATKMGQTGKKPTAAEVAEMLAASTSSRHIMTSVLSTFAAEQVKNAGLMKSSTGNSTEVTAVDSSTFVPHNPSQNHYQIPAATMAAQIATSQTHYHSMPNNQGSQQYVQYTYSSIPPPPPPQTYMVSPMATMSQQQQQLQQQMGQQQQMPLMNPQQSGQLPMQPLTPSFRPAPPMQQPPGMVYYAPHHSQ